MSKEYTVNQHFMSLSTYYLEDDRHLARLHRRRHCRRSAYVPTSNTASHDNHEEITSWVSFSFLYRYGAHLRGPSGRWSTAITNVLNKHIASVEPTLANNLPPTNCHYLDILKKTKSTDLPFAFNQVTPEEVRLGISCITNNKSHGLFSYPMQILKCSSNLVSGILADILNISISTGVYPSELKMAKIILIFKQDEDTDVNNNRLTVLLSNFNRIFETVMFKRMGSY